MTTFDLEKFPPHVRDFWFYVMSNLDMIGRGEVSVEFNSSGISALEAWKLYDSTGKLVPTCDPDTFSKVLRAKKSWNLQIKMWAEGIAEGTFTKEEIRKYCIELCCPEWVQRATFNQADKLRYNNHNKP